MPKIHCLKTDPDVFEASWTGEKSYEIRLNDRGFQVSDLLLLEETRHSGKEMKEGKPLEYTGRRLLAHVQHVLKGPIYGLYDGWVLMSVRVSYRLDNNA